MNNIQEIEYILGYKFKDISLLENALIHRSYTNEHKNTKLKNNERLEFLGDAVLEVVVSEYLYKTSDKPEGELSKMRASIVCEKALSSWCHDSNLGKYLMLGRGEDISGGRKRDSLLSDALEAIIGAIYLDSNIKIVYDIVINNIMKKIINDKDYFIDSKTELQEIIQEQSDLNIEYRLIDESGPDHDKIYITQVLINNICLGVGKGSSKKSSQQEAAKRGLHLIDSIVNKDKFWKDIKQGKDVFKRS